MKISNQDWKLFREKLPQWQERYMQELNYEYIRILNGNESPSDRFWKLEKRINKDKKSPGVLLRVSKENMVYDMAYFVKNGIATPEDLTDFSNELIEMIKFIMG